MVLSPLQFAKEWEITRSRVLSSLAGDVKLLFLVEFYPHLEEHRQDHAYQSYFDECRALAFPLLTDEVLSDLSPDEIDAVVGMVTCLAESPGADVVASGLRTRTAGVAARSHFYVGELEAGLRFAAIAANTGMPKFELTEL